MTWQATFQLQTTSLNRIIRRFFESFIKIYISIANCCTSEQCSSMRKDCRSRVNISSTYCVFVILCMKCVECYISTMFLETTKLHSVYLYIYLKICLWNKTFAHPYLILGSYLSKSLRLVLGMRLPPLFRIFFPEFYQFSECFPVEVFQLLVITSCGRQ